VELSRICRDVGKAELAALPGFDGVIAEYTSEFRDGSNDATNLLYYAFCYLDEYVYADWDRISGVAYEAFRLSKPGWPDRPAD
jgi:hypothetical protein